MRRRGALVGLVVGVLLATGPAALWWLGGVGTGGAAAVAPPPRVQPVALPDPAGPTATAAPVAEPAAPARVRVVDAGVDAPVVDTGVDERGSMAVPQDVRTVGWYRFGARPGASSGSVVLAGHVDDRDQGLGAFHRLADVAVGGRVDVVLADGTTVSYRISGVERVTKAALPVDRLFARDGPPRLALVTCGGVFDRTRGGYTDNVVVSAEPEAGA